MNYDEWKLRTPPDNTEVEKVLCIQCGYYYEPKYMNICIINISKSIYCCNWCLEKLNEDEE